jgi:hypothetical protein
MKDFKEMEKDIIREAEERLNNAQDKGHIALMEDVKDLLNEAVAFEYHDFLNEKYPAPKVELVTKLRKMVDRAMAGDYDN